MASNSNQELPECVIERNLPGLSGVKFLKGAAIYGANASGKSNVVDAFRFLQHFVIKSATAIGPGQPTGTQPFKLDRTSASMPSRFEITFVANDVRYLFGLSVTPQRVMEEYLVAYPNGSPQRWYHRTFNETTNSYDWAKPSRSFKHDKALQDKTRDNALFLSTGPQFNHAQLMEVFTWFATGLGILSKGNYLDFLTGFTALLTLVSMTDRDRILSLLNKADIGVTNARILERKDTLEEVQPHITPADLSRYGEEIEKGQIVHFDVSLSHVGEGGELVLLDYKDEESDGTKRFFALAGPWIDMLDNGYTVILDEIEASLHPNLVRELIKLVFSNETNPKGAQVIFTTHNPVLLDNTLMRRDQIWFTEKVPFGATLLYPLTDFQPRKDEALSKGYLAGRYGGVPYLPDGLKP